MSWFGVKKRLNFRFGPKNQPQFRWRPFFSLYFLETACFGLKKRLNFPEKSASISVKTFFFNFFKTTCFWAEKTFEFPSFPRNSVSIFGQTVWNWFKNNENSGQGRLHFSHSFKKAPPPFPNPGYAPVNTITEKAYRTNVPDQYYHKKAYRTSVPYLKAKIEAQATVPYFTAILVD